MPITPTTPPLWVQTFDLTSATIPPGATLSQAATGGGLGPGTVTSVAVTSADGSIVVTGSPITTSGTINLSVAGTAVTPGSYGDSTHYPTFTVNGNGLITAAGQQTIAFQSLTTTGTSGPATLSGGVLNIPQYSGGSSSPLTTKGDLYTYSTADARLPIGANNTILAADSAQTTGNKWATVSSMLDAVFSSTRGSLLYRGASAWSALAPGSAGYLLQTNGSGADPSWGATSTITPNLISGIVAWFKADTGTFQTNGGSAATANNDPVGQWVNQVGGANDFLQPTAGNRLSLKTNTINGLPSLFFDGSLSWMKMSSLVLSAFTIVVVFKATGTAGFIYEHSANSNSNDGCYLYTTTGATINVRRTSNDTKNGFANWGVGSNWNMVIHEFNGAFVTHRGQVNGFPLAESPVASVDLTASSTTADFYLGSRAGSSLFSQMNLAEIIIYNVALSQANRRLLADYLQNRYAQPF